MSGISHFLSFFKSGIWDGICKVGYAKRSCSSWSNRFWRGQVGSVGLAVGKLSPLFRINLPSISAPVPRPLSLSLPVPPVLCPCFCLLPLGRSQLPAHTHLRPLNDQLYAGHIHTTLWARSTVTPASNCHTRACHRLFLLHYKPSCGLCGPLVDIE